ncbi:hypothetical protein RSJ42_14780 [Methanosarcina hadiensis]|uniref:hypothetical protein n=1 Tax=Methanosarcina hadiensis TaxID=3078083 RepID=UPI0039774484
MDFYTLLFTEPYNLVVLRCMVDISILETSAIGWHAHWRTLIRVQPGSTYVRMEQPWK